MKNIIKTFALAIFVVVLSACQSDLMDLSPYNQVSSANMWANENLADKGVLGVYSALRSECCGNYLYNYEQFSASCTPRNGIHALLKGNATASNGTFTNSWKNLYEGVSRANDAIAHLPEVPGLADAKKARLIAESKFLRAWFYYNLNVLYKGVPLYLEPTELDDYTKGRNTEAEVWAQVLKDLSDAISEANLPNKYEKGNGNYGHITKGAAYALRGKVNLWMKNYSAAESDFKAVASCGYSLFTGSYKQLFKEANEQCDEMIFSVQNVGLSGYGQDMSFRYGTRSTFGSCWNNYYPSTDFVDTYEYANGKKFDWEEVIPGYTTMDVKARAVYFYRDNMTDAEKTAMANTGADMSKYLDNGNEARILQAYTDRDPRLTQTIITPYSAYNGVLGGADQEYHLRWPYRSDVNEPHDMRTDTNAYFYYTYRKFVAEGASEIPNRQYSQIDLPLIRYADVVLGLAEALNEQGKTDEAITYVNMVRDRAGVAALNSNEYTQVTDQADLRTRIQNERRWEFNGEGVTFFDELRWGTWKEKVFLDGNAGLKQIWGQITEAYSYGGDYYQTWAIPVTECEMNSNLTQNPGWIN